MEAKEAHHCIEFRFRYSDRLMFVSVDRYISRLSLAAHLRGERAISFHEVRWTIGAPQVEELAADWQESTEGRVRICDGETYNSQMRQMTGLEDRTDDWVARCMS